MLGRKYRATREEIESTVRTGMVLQGDILYSKYSRLDSKKPTFAIVVSKNNEKTSVGRHLIKRKISGYLEDKIKKIGQNFKKNLIFFIKKDIKVIDWDKIEKDIDFILEKSDFYK